MNYKEYKSNWDKENKHLISEYNRFYYQQNKEYISERRKQNRGTLDKMKGGI